MKVSTAVAESKPKKISMPGWKSCMETIGINFYLLEKRAFSMKEEEKCSDVHLKQTTFMKKYRTNSNGKYNMPVTDTQILFAAIEKYSPVPRTHGTINVIYFQEWQHLQIVEMDNVYFLFERGVVMSHTACLESAKWNLMEQFYFFRKKCREKENGLWPRKNAADVN